MPLELTPKQPPYYETVDGPSPTPSVKYYTANLTQTGTNAPVATVFTNTLGGTLVWARAGAGTYTATLIGAFVLNKTWALIAGLAGGFTYIIRDSADQITLTVQDDAVTPMDDYLFETPIEIRIYP